MEKLTAVWVHPCLSSIHFSLPQGLAEAWAQGQSIDIVLLVPTGHARTMRYEKKFLGELCQACLEHRLHISHLHAHSLEL